MNENVKKAPARHLNSLPIEGYALIVDGKIKSKYDSLDAAHQAGVALKQKFTAIQISVFDAVEQTRMPVALPAETLPAEKTDV